MRVELQDIHKYFGPVHANEGISLTFEPGRIYALLGENGAGKSTLMKILSGYQAPTSGQIRIDGRPVAFSTPVDALTQGVGMLYQDPADFPPLKVIENYLLAYDNVLVLKFNAARRTLEEYAARFGFHIDASVHVDTLTLGERQQMELLRLLALGASLLILDEPTTGISAEQKDILFATMRRLAHEEQKTIILVSHKLEEVQELCDEVAVLRQGKLVGMRSIPCPTAELVRLMFGEEAERVAPYTFETGAPALRLQDAEFGDFRLTVRNITFDLHEGEVLGLAGLEGSGQSLLLQACAGLIPVRKGRLLLDGAVMAGRRSPVFWLPWLAAVFLAMRIALLVAARVRGEIGMLELASEVFAATLIAAGVWLAGVVLVTLTSQLPYHQFQQQGGAYVPAGRLEEGLVPGLTLTEHMALVEPGNSFFVDWARARETVASRIRQFNVVGRPDSQVDELSGGNQQRAMLALLKSPLRLLLLEHPTRGLDVTSANWIWSLFQERRREGTAIMFVSADLDELLEHSDRIAVFSGGALLRIVSACSTSVSELGHLIGGEQT